MGFGRQVGFILVACAFGCLAVWIQNEQIELSYSLWEKEAHFAQLKTEECELRSQLAALGSPGELTARSFSEGLNVRPDETYWVLRPSRWNWREKERRSELNPIVLALARGALRPIVRALALRVQELHP